MNKLISAHIARLKKDKCFRICILLMAFMAPYRVIDSYLSLKKYNVSEPLESPFYTYVFLSALLLPVFCSLFLGTEFSDGTIRNKLIVGHTRTDIYLSSLLLCVMAGFCICIAYMILALCIGIPMLGFFVIDIRIILSLIGCSFALSMAFAAIHTFVAMLNQNRAVTAVICILGVFLLITIGSYINTRLSEPETCAYVYASENGEFIRTPEEPNPFYVSGVRRDVYEFLNEFLPGGQAAALSSVSASHPGRMALYSSLITVVTTGFGIYFFQKKDIK